jgi:hypothetical protein
MRLLVALAAASLVTLGAAPQEPAKVVVHEWGTFTSVAGGDGASLDWRPLAGPSDLPSFVYDLSGSPKGFRHGQAIEPCNHKEPNQCKGCTSGTIRMETPVLYFYSDRETTLSVKVDFPKGKITEWYPAARNVGHGIDWGQVRILPKAEVAFLTEKGASHYYPARETDANPIRVCRGKNPEHEKFLFYRGVGTFDLPISVSLEEGGKKVRLQNRGEDPIRPVIVFENRGGKKGYGIYALAGEKRDIQVARPLDEGTIAYPDLDVEGALLKHLIETGLYVKEAKAMLKTWRDSWFEPGLRVFYVVPKMATARTLPLHLDPAPAELVRVLVGRAEIITPEMETVIAGLAAKLGNDSIETRESASKALAAYGRFAEPVLKKILATTTDPEVKIRIQRLIGG